mgnify:CR=1 FL=1
MKLNLNKSDIDYQKMNTKFKDDGYIVIRNLIDSKTVIEIKKELSKYLKRNRNKFSKRNINFVGDNINSIHNISNWQITKQLQRNTNFSKLISSLLGNNYKTFGSEIFAKPAKKGLRVPLHQDNFYWCLDPPLALTVWIALDKSNKKNGSIKYYKNSHNLGVFQHECSNMPGSSQKLKHIEGLNVFKLSQPDLLPGDCLIHHCNIIHESEENTSNEPRVGWTLRFRGKQTKIKEIVAKSESN